MKKLLMCEPTGYDVNYVINPYMEKVIVDKDLALRQWRSVRDALIDGGAEVQTVKGDPAWPDMVFAANAGYVYPSLDEYDHPTDMLMASFLSEHRKGEPWRDRLESCYNGPSMYAELSRSFVAMRNGMAFEGQGDIVTYVEDDQYKFVVGYGQRTGAYAATWVIDWLVKQGADPSDITTIKLNSKHFYHLDTCMFKGTLGGLMVAEAFSLMEDDIDLPGIDRYSVNRTDGAVMTIVTVGEGKSLCCNAVETTPGTVVSGLMPSRVRGVMKDFGYNLIEVDTSEFLKAGGSVRCMTLDLSLG